MERLTVLRNEVNRCQSSEIEHEKKLNALERERNQLLDEKLQIQKNQQERASNEEKKKELENATKECNDIIMELEQVIRVTILPVVRKISDSLFDHATPQLQTNFSCLFCFRTCCPYKN